MEGVTAARGAVLEEHLLGLAVGAPAADAEEGQEGDEDQDDGAADSDAYDGPGAEFRVGAPGGVALGSGGRRGGDGGICGGPGRGRHRNS